MPRPLLITHTHTHTHIHDHVVDVAGGRVDIQIVLILTPSRKKSFIVMVVAAILKMRVLQPLPRLLPKKGGRTKKQTNYTRRRTNGITYA